MQLIITLLKVDFNINFSHLWLQSMVIEVNRASKLAGVRDSLKELSKLSKFITKVCAKFSSDS